MIELLKIIYWLVAITNFIVAVFVLLKGIKKKPNWLFFLLVMACNGWLISNYFSYFVRDLNVALIAARVSYFFASLIMPFLILFVYNFPFKTSFKNKNYFIIIIPAILSVFLSFGPWFVKSIEIKEKINFYVNGNLHLFYTLSIGLYLIIYCYIYFKKFKQANPIEKSKLKYIVIGLIITALFSIYFDLLYPYIHKIEAWSGGVYGSPTTIIFTLSVAYAILRYRLLDIRIVIQKSFVQLMTFVILFAIYAYALILIQNVSSKSVALNNNTGLLITIFVIALTIEPLRKWIYKLIDGIFENKEKQRQEALQRVQLVTNSTLQFQTLLTKTQVELESVFGSGIDFYLAERKTGNFIQYPKGDKKLAMENSVGMKILPGNILIADELPYRIENGETALIHTSDWLKQNHYSAVVPIGSEEEMVGIFCLPISTGHQKPITADMVRFLKEFQTSVFFPFASAYAYKLAIERIALK
ncbi:MAG: histidine kinase N-terminal 7TM domain-containing protein [Patescibacteria group bacterium]|jgi:hypothetical protein